MTWWGDGGIGVGYERGGGLQSGRDRRDVVNSSRREKAIRSLACRRPRADRRRRHLPSRAVAAARPLRRDPFRGARRHTLPHRAPLPKQRGGRRSPGRAGSPTPTGSRSAGAGHFRTAKGWPRRRGTTSAGTPPRISPAIASRATGRRCSIRWRAGPGSRWCPPCSPPIAGMDSTRGRNRGARSGCRPAPLCLMPPRLRERGPGPAPWRSSWPECERSRGAGRGTEAGARSGARKPTSPIRTRSPRARGDVGRPDGRPRSVQSSTIGPGGLPPP